MAGEPSKAALAGFVVDIADAAHDDAYNKSESGGGGAAAGTDVQEGEEVAQPVVEEIMTPGEGFGEENEEEENHEPRVITSEEHAENIIAMEKVLDYVLEMAAEGKLPTREEKEEFEMKTKSDSTTDLLAEKKEEAEEVPVEDVMSVVEEGSEEEEEVEEEEELESASVQEACAKRQQLLAEFDAVHDEGQRLRIMNMLLHARVMRIMQRRPKKKGGISSISSVSRQPPTPSTTVSSDIPDLSGMAEALEKELLEAGEVRRQLEAEMHRGPAEEKLRQRLAAARQGVTDREEVLEQLQQKLLAKLRAPPVRRQEAEKMLKRVWPQLQRLRKERLNHLRAKHELDSAQRQVSTLEVFGPNRTVAAYEQLVADGMKLAERVQERSEQLAALRTAADRDLQQAAHLREGLQGTHQEFLDARRSFLNTTMFLQKARQKVLKAKMKRDTLYKENSKLTRQMELLAYPDLLGNHEEVLWRLPGAQTELSQLRGAYVKQEQQIAAARRLLQQREQAIRAGLPAPPSPDHPFLVMKVDAKCGTSLIQADQDG